jgi:hypothetical protein
MFYILNLDHHGDYQGVYHRFDTKDEARAFLEKKPDTIRVGMIGYNINSITGKKLLCNIIFQSSEEVSYDKGIGYYVENEGDEDDEEPEFEKDMNKMLNFIRKYKHIIADNIFE